MDSSPTAPPGRCQSVGMSDMPVELVVEFMEQMSPTDLASFVLANRSFRRIFVVMNQGLLMTMTITVLKRQPEFEIVLFIHTADVSAEGHPERMMRSRTVNFFPGNDAIRNLMQGNPSYRRTTFGPLTMHYPVQVALFPHDIATMCDLVNVIDWWVSVYPSLRWRKAPEHRRCLRPGEEIRLRKAVARWWLYACHHHKLRNRNRQAPKMWEANTRLHHIRVLSTSEILELEDLWRLIFDTISRDLCSSVELRGYVSDLVPWGQKEDRHTKIVDTYMKLDPRQLKDLLTSLSGGLYKGQIMSRSTRAIQEFSRDRESLSISINKVLQERLIIKGMHDRDQLPRMGIVDEDRDDELKIAPWIGDEWPDGLVPLTDEEIKAFPPDPSTMMPRGDDGSDEYLPQ
ncbi:hypothetical protein AAE478_006038 [Parahypoxylon ruwenzoriense]